jgi:S1-C subfamily serine protease
MTLLRLGIGALLSLIVTAASGAASPPALAPAPVGGELEAMSRALQRAHAAVIGVRAFAVENARSNAVLGRTREGSGVVIGGDGLVLTIGYLILEADQVQLELDDERIVPARVLAYDVATGFGLLQALTPLRLAPVPLGRSASMAPKESLMIASGGEDGAVSVVRLVSRRAFVAYWEYRIDGALFTTPPRGDHSGAGLFNSRGELIGIGSLYVADALGAADGPRIPGNMFVPIDLLKPVLDELRRNGSSRASHRAWIGINAIELEGQVRVLRVNDDSPADAAGVQPGDSIVSIDGTAIAALDALWQSLWAGGAPEREVTLEIRRGGETKTLKLQTVDRMQTLRRTAEGI